MKEVKEELKHCWPYLVAIGLLLLSVVHLSIMLHESRRQQAEDNHRFYQHVKGGHR